MKLWGFDASDERACNKPDRDNGVPSLAYNIEESMGQSMQSGRNRESAKLGKKGVFGSQANRSDGFALNPPTGECPGPGQHQNLESRDGFYRLKGNPTDTSFRSGVERLPRDPMEDKTQKPSPGSYEAFDKVNYRNKFRQVKSDHLSFGSSASRWSPTEVACGVKFSPNPGPGVYDQKLMAGHIAGGAISNDKRRGMGRDASGDAPKLYNVHGSTMHRTTYNVSGAEAAQRAQGKLRNQMEPPNVGGGAGGGITGTRSRLGQCPGGAGANTLQADKKTVG